jgi:3-oxoacyl-[acyl-carrier-protein] synthase-3
MPYSRIAGVGSYLPEKVLSNFDLEKMVDTSDEWIVSRTGIRERRIVGNHETVSDMAEIAAQRAIANAGINKDDIELIIVATMTGELITPSIACVMQERFGIKNTGPAYDINAACAGFIYGMDIIDQYIKNGSVKCALLIAPEAISKIVDWNDRHTCVLFGDGAGAAILKADNQPGVRSTHIHANGQYAQLLYAPNTLYKFNQTPYLRMTGHEIFKIAVTELSNIVQKTIEHNNITGDDVDWLVPHQANFRIISAMAKKLKIPMERVILTIEEHGNTSAASVPLALDAGIQDGRIKRGDTLLMEAFGAGLTWGAALVDY